VEGVVIDADAEWEVILEVARDLGRGWSRDIRYGRNSVRSGLALRRSSLQ